RNNDIGQLGVCKSYGKYIGGRMKKRKLPKKELQTQIALGTFEEDDLFRLLRSKKTSGEIIEILYNSNIHMDEWLKSQMRALITKHHNTPATVLASIFHQGKFMGDPNRIDPYDANVLSHPSLPAELLHDILHKIKCDPGFSNTHFDCFKAIENPNIPIEFLKDLSIHKNDAVRFAVAEHHNTPPNVLEALAKDKGNGIRWSSWSPQIAVAENPKTPPYVLKVLTIGTTAAIKQKVAANPSTPVDTLKAIVAAGSKNRARRIALD
ncbi:unnamed protein product, partial [marine sediment metagenome]